MFGRRDFTECLVEEWRLFVFVYDLEGEFRGYTKLDRVFVGVVFRVFLEFDSRGFLISFLFE